MERKVQWIERKQERVQGKLEWMERKNQNGWNGRYNGKEKVTGAREAEMAGKEKQE